MGSLTLGNILGSKPEQVGAHVVGLDSDTAARIVTLREGLSRGVYSAPRRDPVGPPGLEIVNAGSGIVKAEAAAAAAGDRDDLVASDLD